MVNCDDVDLPRGFSSLLRVSPRVSCLLLLKNIIIIVTIVILSFETDFGDENCDNEYGDKGFAVFSQKQH